MTPLRVLVSIAVAIGAGCTPPPPRATPPPPAESPTPDVTPGPEAAADVTRYLRLNYGDQPWHAQIKRVSIEGRAAIAHTGLQTPDQSSADICRALSTYVLGTGAHGLRELRVVGAGDVVLHSRKLVGERC